MLDFIRIACAVPAVKVGDVKKNVEDICRCMEEADRQNVDVLLFTEPVRFPDSRYEYRYAGSGYEDKRSE